MEVENHHNFSVNGGFILHNCDAIRGFCIYRSRPNMKQPEMDADRLMADYEEKQFANSNMFDVYNQKEEDPFDFYNSNGDTGWF